MSMAIRVPLPILAIIGIAAAGEISAAKARLKLMVVLSEHPEYATQRDKLEEIFDI